ncbi:MAG TPA: DUF2950 domain-containing protein [Thermoanaerobaculia bacterium]|jgi:hypothetical protein
MMTKIRLRLLLVSLSAFAVFSPAASAILKQRTFATPRAAADALADAATRFDVPDLLEILGPDGTDLVVTGDPVLDKTQASNFATAAKEKLAVETDKANPKKATVVVGKDDWPLPIPLVEQDGKWRFDSAAGRREILLRRIGRNELDAIEVCEGYVEAQEEYASEPRGGASVTQYAQKVIGGADKQDGLGWRDADGTWRGPIGEKIAQAIAEGYDSKYEPYHGYYFKILKGQGPHAPLGQLDYVVKGLMIGGFALVASPAEYGVTGVKSFLVSNDGVVYEKDLGPKTLETFAAMERFDPDDSWSPVSEKGQVD